MKNKLFKKLLILIFFTGIASAASAQISKCTTSSGAITSTGDCYSNATTMSFPVTKLMLCKTKPTAPTLSTAVSNISAPNCVTFYSNNSGNTINAQKGTLQIGSGVIPQAQFLQNAGVGTGGNLTIGGGQNSKGNSATFTYAYIEAEPYVSVTAQANFNATKTGLDNSTGSTCWSTSVTIYSFGSVPATGSSCGTNANPSATKVMMNSLGTGAAYMSDVGSVSNGVTTDTYLVDSSLKLAANTTSGSMGIVSKVINIQTLNVTFNAQSGGINALVQVSEGAWVNQSSVFGKVYFQNGNANLLMSARQGGS